MPVQLRSIVPVLAAASFFVAAPAIAGKLPDPLTAKPAAAPAAQPTAKKICMKRGPVTGSRVSKEECRTRAEWEADGYTVTTRAKAKADQKN